MDSLFFSLWLDWSGIGFLCFEVGLSLYSFLLFGLNFMKFKFYFVLFSTEFWCWWTSFIVWDFVITSFLLNLSSMRMVWLKEWINNNDFTGRNLIATHLFYDIFSHLIKFEWRRDEHRNLNYLNENINFYQLLTFVQIMIMFSSFAH